MYILYYDLVMLKILCVKKFYVTLRLDCVTYVYRILDRIKRLQNMMVNHLVIKKMMPLMARENELFGREALALCNVLLFNANSNAQVCFKLL